MQVIILGCVISHICVLAVHISNENRYSYGLIGEFVDDVGRDVNESVDEWMKDATSRFAEYLEKLEHLNNEYVEDIVRVNPDLLSEMNIVDSNGIIKYSSVPEYVGFDMASGEQSAEFMCLLNGEDYYQQDIRGNSYDESIRMLYAGKAFSDGSGFVEIGITEEKFFEGMSEILSSVVKNRRIGLTGCLMIVDGNMDIIGSSGEMYNGRKFDAPGILPDDDGADKQSKTKLFGQKCYIVATKSSEFYIVGCYPVSEARRNYLIDRLLIFLMNAAIFSAVFLVLSFVLKRHVVHGIENINASLSRITEGDLEEKADVRTSLEFGELSDGINDTVDRLKTLIAEAESRIDEELETAKSIQRDSLPKVGDAFRKRTDFGLYASMDTAKLVGGDFYDFYFLPGDILAVTIADVSDKGIPAAMFMMRAKSILKGLAEEGLSIDRLVTEANKSLWENNEGDMFVTVWMGFIELETGKVRYVHAGHTCPVRFNKDGAELVKQKRELLVGGMPDAAYHEQEMTLKPGDTLLLYTDGVTEAVDRNKEEFGYDRLLELLSGMPDRDEDTDPSGYCQMVCERVHEEVMSFAEGEPQADDITMLCVRYEGKRGR
ncbi:MAG: SpoIIE family protein phosphatase [Lachnospiraceae bacterium]|nr:SpoIIE family protein phosphatase [Lachnospiraceae bacterium]